MSGNFVRRKSGNPVTKRKIVQKYYNHYFSSNRGAKLCVVKTKRKHKEFEVMASTHIITRKLFKDHQEYLSIKRKFSSYLPKRTYLQILFP